MIRICLALWAALAALPARAEETKQYRTVAGAFALVQAYAFYDGRRFEDGIDLVLNGRVIAHSDDRWVDVAAELRDPGEGPLALDRILLLERISGGSGCAATWQVAEFRADGTVLLSKEFNLCSDTTPQIEQHDDGSLIITFDYDPVIAPDAYLYRDGTVRQVPAVAAARHMFATAAGTLETVARSGADGSHPVDLVLNGHVIGEGEGLDVEVHASFPDPKQARLLLLAFGERFHLCYASWMVLEIPPDRPPQATPLFAGCRWPPDIVQLKGGGLLLYFSDADPLEPDTYLYADHQFRPFNRERTP